MATAISQDWERKEFIVVTCDDVDSLVRQHYHKDFSALADQADAVGQGACIMFRDIEPQQLTKIEQDAIKALKANGDHEGLLESLLTDMCNKKVIEPGSYLVQFDW